MRFTIFDKLLLVILLLFVIALSALCVGAAMELVSLDMINGAVGIMMNGLIGNKLILGGIGLVLLIIALRLFIAMGKKPAKREAPAPTSTLLLNGDGGTAYITIAALDSLVQRHCRANQKIRECESAVNAGQNGVAVSLRLQVTPETVIPELVTSLQQSLKEYLESICGIQVSGVDILILPTAQPKVPRAI